MQSVSFSAASSALSSFQLLNLGGIGPEASRGIQFARLFVKSTGGTAASDVGITLALVDGATEIARFDGLATIRTDTDAAGLKLCDLVMTEGSGSKFDLLGCGSYDNTEIVGQGSRLVWAIGVTALGGGTAATVLYSVSKEV